MKRIIKTALVSSRFSNNFYEELNDHIMSAQKMGLEVEVQYQLNDALFSALVIGKQAERLIKLGYRKQSETAKEVLEKFIIVMIDMGYITVNDDIYYEMLEVKDELLQDYGVTE